MRICIRKSDKRIIEMQSNATEGTLITNALTAGYTLDEIEEREVDEAGYADALAEDPVEIAAKAKAEADAIAQAAKTVAIADAKDSISTIETAVEKAADLETLRKNVLELVKAVKVLTA